MEIINPKLFYPQRLDLKKEKLNPIAINFCGLPKVLEIALKNCILHILTS